MIFYAVETNIKKHTVAFCNRVFFKDHFWSRRRDSAPRAEFPRADKLMEELNHPVRTLVTRPHSNTWFAFTRCLDQKCGATTRLHRIFGRGDGILAFSGAPRSDVINVVLCCQIFHYPSFVKQSVLLSQNGSPPRIPSQAVESKNSRNTDGDTAVLVEATGFEPTTFASRTQRATNCATPRYFAFPPLDGNAYIITNAFPKVNPFSHARKKYF